MPSFRSLALLTAALCATARAANTVTVINQCSYAVLLTADHESAGLTTSTLAAGATSSAIAYDETPLHVRAYTDTNINDVAFEALVAMDNVYYDVVESVSGSAVGSAFTLTTSAADCPGIDGADANITPTDANTSHQCASRPSFTWTLCP